MSDDLPYLVEYAKTGRASCKACKSPIPKDNLRLAVLVQSPFHDGKLTNWFHAKCFFLKQRPKTVGDIAHFDNIRIEDQQFIKNKIAEASALPIPQAKGKKRSKAAAKAAYKDFKVEYAKSNRSKCIGCEEIIVKGEVRIAKKDFESEDAKKYGGLDRWHHVDCFAKLQEEKGFLDSGDMLPGADALTKEDQQMLKEKIKKIGTAGGAPPVKKAKVDPEEAALEDKIAKQNKKMFSFRDKLKALSKKELVSLLTYNKHSVPVGNAEMLDVLCDMMTFGVVELCPKCHGELHYASGTGYKCTGNIDEWSKCENIIPKPNRTKFRAPKDLKEDYAFLNEKFKVEERAFKVTVSSVVAVKKEESEVDGPKTSSGPKPLKHMDFFLVGRLKGDKESLKRDILLLGGHVSSKLHQDVVAVISTENDVKKMSSKIQEAEEMDIQVISEDFVEAVKNSSGDAKNLLEEKKISGWGADPSTRMMNNAAKSMKSKSGKSQYEKSVSGKVKVKVKGGGVVDPDSGLEDIAQVYQSGKDKFTVTLGITDIQKNKNSYYKMQILKHDRQEKYWLFRSWGRIGTTVGGNKLEKMSLEECIEQFHLLFKEKSGNSWSNRGHFKKVPGCMYPLDIDDGVADAPIDLLHSSVESKLKQPVQKLMELIFDEKLMKKAMMEMEIDTEKMPLGKLSKKQLQEAFGVLSTLQQLIKSGNAERTQLIGQTNRFYTLVPHDFGMKDPTIIDTEELIELKNQMLEALMEMEIAYNLLHSKVDSTKNPLDAHYDLLNCNIDVMDPNCEEFQLIRQYVKNTHAATHSTYELDIEDVFIINRQGEEKRYKPFKKLPNRKLLWHGSRVTNYVGILSQGLRIAPPEAPVTGYMFGKGIYFADMVSKSANYCCTSMSNPTGLLLLCEVALGNMYERYQADYIEKLPKGKHSTLGRGGTQPDPAKSHVTKDGVEIPIGPGVSSNLKTKSSLLYNEYIVYDVAQAKMNYLVRTKFNYKF